MTRMIFVDCEAVGGAPSVGHLTEFGAVDFESRKSFHGVLWESEPDPVNPAIPRIIGQQFDEKAVFQSFATWLKQWNERVVFVSDNNGYDSQWINDGFLRTLGENPFGHSSRRISDFYAGLTGDWKNTQGWKRLRITPHTHNPVDDALGNCEAFERLLNGER